MKQRPTDIRPANAPEPDPEDHLFRCPGCHRTHGIRYRYRINDEGVWDGGTYCNLCGWESAEPQEQEP